MLLTSKQLFYSNLEMRTAANDNSKAMALLGHCSWVFYHIRTLPRSEIMTLLDYVTKEANLTIDYIEGKVI